MAELRDLLLDNSFQTLNQIKEGEPNGFLDRDDSVMSFDEVNRRFSIAPAVDEYEIFSVGKLFTITEAKTIDIPDVEGRHFIYFDETGELATSQAFDPRLIFGPYCFTSVIIWDKENQELPFGGIQNERHGLMDSKAHARWHTSDGMVITSGLDLVGFDMTGNGSSDACCQFGRDAGAIADEDISMTLSERASTASPHVAYLAGTGTPNWRKGSPAAGTCLLLDGGVVQYNKVAGDTYSLEDVSNGNYVNYHVFVSTSDTEEKMEIVVPGPEQYWSKSEAIVQQIEEVKALASSASKTAVELAEYRFIGSILYRANSIYSNVGKAVVVSIGGGLEWNDFRGENLSNGNADMNGLVIPVVLNRVVDADFTFQESDMELNADTTTGKIIGTLPAISSLERTDRVWEIQKITDDIDPVMIRMTDITDSQCGDDLHTYKLTRQGSSLRIGITENMKYTFKYIMCAEQAFSPMYVATLTPEIASTTLTMNGDLTEISAEIDPLAQFRYRKIGELVWVVSTGQTVSVEGEFTEDVTVTAGEDYEVQAIVTDRAGTINYGDVKNTISNFYPSLDDARIDGLAAYWPLQETTGTDVTGVEALGSGLDMNCAGGVSISSDTINGNVIYKRGFTVSSNMQAAYQHSNGADLTLLVQCDCRTTSGDHTLFSTGRNVFSCAPDGTAIQSEVNGSKINWNGATPTGMINLVFRVNRATNTTVMLEVSTLGVTQRTFHYRVPSHFWNYLRMANGTVGDSNHQSGEYLANGDIRSIAVWTRRLSNAELVDLMKTLDTKGMLIV